MNGKRILMWLMILVFVIGFGVVAFAEGEQKKEEPTINIEDIKYVPFPNEFKKYEVSPWEMLNFPEFNKTYKKILGVRVKEKWLKKLDGPSTSSKMIDVDHSKFVVIHSCKQHYCDTHLVLVFFNPVTSQVWGLLVENKKIIWLGNPNMEIKNSLKDIAKITWPELSVIKSIK